MNMAARALERVGDNAVDIGEQVGFLLTGEFREFTDASIRWTPESMVERGRTHPDRRGRGRRSPIRSGTTSSAKGYVVTVAADGRQALERFRAEPPALVILDLMLPEVSGLDVCRAIRAESDVPIIMVTAKDSEADKVTGLGARCRRLRHEAVLGPRAGVARPGAAATHPHAARRCARGRARGRARRDGRRSPRGARCEARRSPSRPRSSSCWRRSCGARVVCSRGTS